MAKHRLFTDATGTRKLVVRDLPVANRLLHMYIEGSAA